MATTTSKALTKAKQDLAATRRSIRSKRALIRREKKKIIKRAAFIKKYESQLKTLLAKEKKLKSSIATLTKKLKAEEAAAKNTNDPKISTGPIITTGPVKPDPKVTTGPSTTTDPKIATGPGSINPSIFDPTRVASIFTGSSKLAISQHKKRVSAMDDHYPVLFFPVRLETKFVGNELLIRVFPDEIFVKNLERALTESEREEAETFWNSIHEIDKSRVDSEEKETEKKTSVNQLIDALGKDRAAWALKATWPTNLTTDDIFGDKRLFRLKDRKAVLKSTERKDTDWTAAAYTDMLPDRFMFNLYDKEGSATVKKLGNVIKTDIQLGFDPTQDLVKDQLYQKELKWMFDYKEAVRVGLATTISLEPEQVRDGFSKLTVVGVKYTADITESKAKVIELFENHQFKPDGMGLADVGMATQNVEFQELEKEEQSELDAFIDTHLRGELEGAHKLKTDGERLVEALGFKPSNLSNLQNRAKVDISNSVEMNKILWPSTIEYYLNQFSANTYTHNRNANARKFFLDHVSGRGVLPTLRVGDQAYGVSPVTSFSKWKHSSNATFGEKLLESILNPLYQHVFKSTSETNISDSAEAYKALSENASSKRFSSRAIIGKNIASELNDRIISEHHKTALINRFKSMGIDENDIPDIMHYSMSAEATELNGPVVDSGRVFAKRTLQTSPNHQTNFLGLIFNATSFGDIINHTFNNVALIKQKDSLLYLYVRYAYLREAIKSSLNYLEPNKLNRAVALLDSEFDQLRINKKMTSEMIDYMSLTEKSVVKSEPQFKALISGMNIASAKDVPKASPMEIKRVDSFLDDKVSKSIDANKSLEVPTSKWDYLNNSFSSITGSISMGNFLFNQMALNKSETAELKALREALGNLKDLNVQELENLFSEHIDVASHRLDAWLTGVANERLMKHRKLSKYKTGVYFGAYGFVENLKKDKRSSSDPQGFIHAPSLDQAKVAAIARSGFSELMKEMLKDSTTQKALEDLSIDITSQRILNSLSMIDGLNNGQDIRALLGFQFERGLSKAGLSKYILDFRKKYGTTSSISNKATTDDYKANNTVDGKSLIEAYQKGISVSIVATDSSPAEQEKIEEVLTEVDDSLDGFSDLMHVESLYQMIKGDYSGLAALLKSLNDFERIPEPEFIKTHVHALKHENRVAIIFSEKGNKSVWGNATHKSTLNPWVNEWLGNLLPDHSKILVHLKGSFDKEDNSVVMIDETISIADIMSLEPIDLCVNLPVPHTVKEAFVEQQVKLHISKREQNIVKWNDFILDMKTIPTIKDDEYSLFEVDFIIQQANKILKNGRNLQAQDLANNTEKDDLDNSSQSELAASISTLNSQVTEIIRGIKAMKVLRKSLSTSEETEGAAPFFELYEYVLSSTLECNLNGLPKINPIYSKQNAVALLEFAKAYSEQLENLASTLKKELANLTEPTLTEVKRLISTITIDGEYVTVPFKLKTTSELAKTYSMQSFENITPDFKVNDWLYTASKVKENLTAVMLLDQVSVGTNSVMKLSEVKQLPYIASESNVWMGTNYEGDMDQSRISFVLLSSAPSLKMTQKLSGILVADWDEQIPIKNIDTGVAFHYDAPNAKSPKNILLGVSPDVSGKWDWDDLVEMINETLALSKTRAITLDDLAGTPVEHFLPMTVAPIYEDEESPSLNFLNNNI